MVYMPSQIVDRRGPCCSECLVSRTELVPRPKDLVLKRFKFTEESYQQRFRTSVPEAGQDCNTFRNQLTKLPERWLESAERWNSPYRASGMLTQHYTHAHGNIAQRVISVIPSLSTALIISNVSDVNDGPLESNIRPNKDDPVDVDSSKGGDLLNCLCLTYTCDDAAAAADDDDDDGDSDDDDDDDEEEDNDEDDDEDDDAYAAAADDDDDDDRWW
ncbi:hypothetical protein PoB_002544500 [Plakobranchus ocellatus]|uniref:Uncharacterized protein n=1 Tax=Plakobranchus ocellatus TaxID=259542 RepID=A0AAV3ZUV3_9GAST|nr:hypothetical protein PoB_002544500 [Plakobranchus ocellatus]